MAPLAESLRSWVVGLFLALSLVAVGARAEEHVATECDTWNQKIENLDKEVASQLQQNAKIKELSFSGPQVGISLKGLLEIDLGDEEAVQQKKAFLQDFLSKSGTQESAESQPGAETQPTNCPGLERFPELEASLQQAKSDNAKLVLEYLMLSRNERVGLLTLEKTLNSTSGKITELENVEKELGKKQQNATESLGKARDALALAATENLKKLASERIVLESFRKNLAEMQETSIGRLKRQVDERRQLSERIAEYKVQLNEVSQLDGSNDEALRENYEKVLEDWRKTVDTSTSILSLLRTQSNKLPDLPEYPDDLLNTLKAYPEAIEYEFVYAEEIKDRELFKVNERERLTERLIARDALLKAATFLRTSYIDAFNSRKDDYPFRWSQDFFADLGRELKLVSYKLGIFIVTTARTYGEYWRNSQGLAFDDKISLAKESGYFLRFLFYIVIFYLLFRNTSERINRLEKYLDENHNHPNLERAVSLLSKWAKLLPPIFWLGALWFLEKQIQGTILETLREAIPYLYYYIYYRLFLELFDTFVGFLSEQTRYRESSIHNRVRKSGLWLGRYFLVLFVIARATEQSVGKAIVYTYVQKSLWGLSVIVFMMGAFFWRDEIRKTIQRESGMPYSEKWASLLKGPLAIILSLPSALALLATRIFRAIARLVSSSEHSKRFSSLLFKRQLQRRMEQEKERELDSFPPEVPDDYRKLFYFGPVQEDDFRVEVFSDLKANISKMIESWQQGASQEDTVAIYGDKGGGKTSFAKSLGEKISGVKVFCQSVPPKVIDEAGLLELFIKMLDLPEATSFKDLSNILRTRTEKTLIIFDECQNFYLSKIDGFHGYHLLMTLLNGDFPNIFWCAFFNNYAWYYLNNTVGRNHHFRKIFKMECWDEKAIRELILKRHQESGYKLDYKEINLYRRTKGEPRNDDRVLEIQEKFFRLLWEQCQGNPRVALDIWLRSLRRSGAKTLTVTLFDTQNVQVLSNLSDDFHFLLSGILKHENLTCREASEVTALSAAFCKYGVAIAEDMEVLERDGDGRYRIRPQWLYPVTDLLRKKNFVYGIR